jgi:RNA polymerase sigma factor (sigma-70 family)
MRTLSDIEMVQGLIDGDKNIEQAFLDKYREQIFRTFTNTHSKMKLKNQLTSEIKEELLADLCENLHASKEKLADAISDGRPFNLSAFLEMKCNFFCRDKFLVKALKARDESVTRRVFYGTDEDKEISFRGIIIKVLNEKSICDLENQGKRMSFEDVVPKLYTLLMAQLDQDKFRFICSLKSYFINSIMPSYLNDYYREIGRLKKDIDFDDYEHSGATNVIDTVVFEKKERDEFFKGLFDCMIRRGASKRDIGILCDKFLEEMSYEEIAIKWGESKSNVGVIIHRMKKMLRKVGREYDM